MLTALEGVCCRGQQTLPEVTAAKHLALAEGHVSEVSAGRTASVPPEGIKLPVIQETPLLHQPPEQYTCTSTRQRQSSGIGPEKSGLVAAKRRRAKSGNRVVAPCFLNLKLDAPQWISEDPWLLWEQDAQVRILSPRCDQKPVPSWCLSRPAKGGFLLLTRRCAQNVRKVT